MTVLVTPEVDISLAVKLDVQTTVHLDVFATFDPTVAPSTSVQMADMMPPDPSNIVEVKMTSFDDLIPLPTCNRPSTSKPE